MEKERKTDRAQCTQRAKEEVCVREREKEREL